jgi:hypothetical protein
MMWITPVNRQLLSGFCDTTAYRSGKEAPELLVFPQVQAAFSVHHTTSCDLL